MPILYAELQIAGRQVACEVASFSFVQPTDEKGRPSSIVRVGLLKVVISGEAAGWPIWEEIKFDPYRRESGHLVFFKNAGITAKRYTFYDAALVWLEVRHDGKGTAGKRSATQIELHFSAATIELDGIRLEAHSLIPWETDAQTSFRALTKPADPLPSAHLAAGAGLVATGKKAAEAVAKKALPIAGEGIARTLTLLPGLLLTPTNSPSDPGYASEWELNRLSNHPVSPIPPPPKPDEVRLAELERALAAQTLTAQEEAELIVLLAKVKGIRIQRLDDLNSPNGTTHQLLPGECRVGSFKALHLLGRKGDDITPHHIPSDAFMRKHGVSRNDGICLDMEQPDAGGRHRQTKTFGGHMTPAQREAYYQMTPTQALEHDIADARRVYRDQGLLTPQVEDALQEVIRQNKANFPHIFH